ncbi:MAG: hypothetical protein O9300_14425, partial [Microcystis sp. LE19-195.1E]|nr:hypothetical protein [Microcystis sp. LE19-195.1E]
MGNPKPVRSEVWLIDFGIAAKVRPALVVSEPYGVDILAAVKRTAIPKPHDLGFCFFPLRGSAPALTDLLCSVVLWSLYRL